MTLCSFPWQTSPWPEEIVISLKSRIKPNNLTALRTAPLQLVTLFPDEVLKAEDDTVNFESKGHSSSHLAWISVQRVRSWINQHGKTLGVMAKGRDRETWPPLTYLAKGQQSYKWQLLFKCVGSRTAAREYTVCKPLSVVSVFQCYQKDNEHSDTRQFKCKLKYCKSCTYCKRAFTKERCKSRFCNLLQKEIKLYERCFLCQSIVFCQICNKCPSCCLKSTCRDQTTKLLESLGRSGCRSESSSNPQRRLHPPLSDPAKLGKVTDHYKLLCHSSQEPLPVAGITSAYKQKHSRIGKKSDISEVFQSTIFGPKTQQHLDDWLVWARSH